MPSFNCSCNDRSWVIACYIPRACAGLSPGEKVIVSWVPGMLIWLRRVEFGIRSSNSSVKLRRGRLETPGIRPRASWHGSTASVWSADQQRIAEKPDFGFLGKSSPWQDSFRDVRDAMEKWPGGRMVSGIVP